MGEVPELHGPIAVAAGLANRVHQTKPWRCAWGDDDLFSAAPDFTSSLDAAMMLVPKGWCVWALRQDDTGWWAALNRGERVEGGWAPTPTPALALASAALRARAASGMSAGTAETRSGSGLQPASPVGEAETPESRQP